MTAMTLYYDREPPRVVDTAEELDATLDRIAGNPRFREFPVSASIETPDKRFVLQIVLGAADWSTLVWYETKVDILAPAGTVGYQRRPRYNYGGTATDVYDDALITVPTARQAVREFLQDNTPPTCVTWQEPRLSDAGDQVIK